MGFSCKISQQNQSSDSHIVDQSLTKECDQLFVGRWPRKGATHLDQSIRGPRGGSRNAKKSQMTRIKSRGWQKMDMYKTICLLNVECWIITFFGCDYWLIATPPPHHNGNGIYYYILYSCILRGTLMQRYMFHWGLECFWKRKDQWILS